MKRFYFVVALGKDEKDHRYEKMIAEVEYFTDSENMLATMEKLGGYAAKVAGLKPFICRMCATRKEAEKLADQWNENWKKEGRLFDWYDDLGEKEE